MKILHAAETIKGGVATVLKQLVLEQERNAERYDVRVLIPDEQIDEVEVLDSNNIVQWPRNGRSIKSLISFAKNFICLVLRFRPDIVHLHSSFAGVICRFCLMLLFPLFRTKVIYCPHAFSFMMETSKYKKVVYVFIEKLFMKITNVVICVSKYEYDEGVSYGLNKEKLKIVHNGVSIKDISAIDKKKDKDNKKIHVLFVGRFDYQKGYDILIEAARKLSPDAFTFTIIGGSVHNSGNVDRLVNATYTGWLSSDDMDKYFRCADIVVVPSRWEGFAMVPLEAMSYALPIIASNSTSLPEVVLDKKTGFLFECGNVSSLLKILSGLNEYNLIDMGIMGNNYFRDNFTSENMIKKTHEIYDKVIFK
ncbi:glycosyltransferase involved in cell wall biosynthesis [Gibbsiella quercinecans]|uniref:Glycosyl transferase family 1 n=1 Tax=Gibbsiella quercinecans TaxID=929813 RepID=A0A250AY48_9GAMM|nr:glycosyltransferase [Gibbsiella quercinecans]ATA18622.1 hypothetical protein AWC35_04265 [Gibbsiella quercinecans]RLM14870.1 hypothetical protein BIY30_00025 [Gibbsiella quercinecans]TCT91862.1 glycosyltransferase involved in cell wall biosynthesis [Gibbsiella quercinecans]